MSWKKHVKPVNSILPTQLNNGSREPNVNKFSSWLPEVYAGPPNRLQRYTVYEQMNFDHEISAALDTFADFSTEPDDRTKLPFLLQFNAEPSPSEVQILSRTLQQWCKLNDLNKRMWGIFRSVLQYGDQFFIRDPETYCLYWVDPAKVVKVIINEADGKTINTYYVKDVDLNIKDMVATNQLDKTTSQQFGTNSLVFSPPVVGNINYVSSGATSGTNSGGQEFPIDAQHIRHISLTDGLNATWPFGISILETIYKVYKQKELLEDAILIYRIQRAPERRMFFIDVGTMPENRAQQYLERVKYEVQQKRIPSRTGGGQTVTDSAYNPMSMLEDYYFAVTSDGRGSKVEVLPGGDNLGQIDDLRYFNNKMLRALGVPSSYLPTGPEDGSNGYNDGRVGTAFIQEFRFAKVCKRYQQKVIKPLDEEFKLYLKKRGISIDNSLFELTLSDPQSFSEYRRLELDSAKINTFTALTEIPYVSKRFILKRYLGWTQEELVENERMWKEERGRLKNSTFDAPGGGPGGEIGLSSDSGIAAPDLSDIGITSSGIDNMGVEDGMEELRLPDVGGELPSKEGEI